MKVWSLIFVTVFFSAIISAQNCKFDKNGIEEPPYVWMKNQLPSETIRQIKGRIVDVNDEPIAGAVISVFQLNSDGRKFIGSNESNENGEYCFEDLKKGKYSLKVGKHNFQLYEIEINLEPKNKQADKNLDFTLDIGY